MSTKYESERTVYTRDQILALRAHGSQLSQCVRTIVDGLITTRRTIRGCRGGHHRRPPPLETASGSTGGIILSGNRPATPYDRNQYPNKEHEILRHRGSRKGARKIRQPVRILPGGSVELRWSFGPPRYWVSVPSRQVRPDRRRESELPGVYVINASSLAKPHALDQLSAELTSYDLDIAIIAETHFKAHHQTSTVKVKGFNMFRRDRLARRSGGVGVVVAERLQASEFVVPEDSRNLEFIWIKIQLQTENLYVCAFYHPPKQIYETVQPLDRLERTVNAIVAADPDGLLILGGDFNSLPEADVIERTGLIPLVNEPTRGGKVLDRLFVSRPSYTNVKILTSAIKSDHRAIIATDGRLITSRTKNPVVVNFRRRSPEQNASLLRLLAEMDYSEVVDCPDPQRAWNLFYTSALSLLESVYSTRRVTMISADPPYLTPAAKTMLRRKNRLMRSGRLEEASALARRIGIAIQKANSKHLGNIDPQVGPTDLWRRVNQVINKQTIDEDSGALSAASLNEHYARTSYDNAYSEPLKKHTVLKHQALVSEYRMFGLLESRLHHTADGLDGLPAWFLSLMVSLTGPPTTT